MKKIFIISILLFFIIAQTLFAAEQFQAPLPAKGESLSPENKGSVTVSYEQASLDEILNFYKEAFGNDANIKWVEKKEQGTVVIHDWANRKWHKITIVGKGQGPGVLITVKKDSWTWIIGTLVIRFVGVFIVLIVLMVALYISGSILSEKKPVPGKAKA